MISEYLEIINSYILDSNEPMKTSMAETENKMKSLGIKFPKPFIEFYSYFGHNEQVLNAYYEFEKIGDFKIHNDALVFCYGHQKESLIGVLLKEIEKEDPTIKKTFLGYDEWYSECTLSSKFFVNIACWQVINTMPSIAMTRIDEDKFTEKIEEYLKPISEDKSIFLGYDSFSYYNKEKNLLACYLREAEEFYIASEDDSYLYDFEEESGMDLDWL